MFCDTVDMIHKHVLLAWDRFEDLNMHEKATMQVLQNGAGMCPSFIVLLPARIETKEPSRLSPEYLNED